jgi:uncharacterized protein YbjT (DUF2867 family)
MKQNILVVGATGTVGLEVVNALDARGVSPRVLVRRTRADDGLPASVVHVAGELADRVSLDRALDGVDAAFFVTPHDPREEELGVGFVSACEAAGVKRVVFSCAFRPHAGNAFTRSIVHGLLGIVGPHYRAKFRTERRVHASRLDPVVLLPSNFFQNDDVVIEDILRGEYPVPMGRAPVNRVDCADIGLAAARALLDRDTVRAGAYALVGPEEFTGESAAAAWTTALGREVRYAGDDIARWAAAMRGKMDDAKIADFTRTFGVLQRWGAVPTDRQREETRVLLGREPRSFAAWARDRAAHVANAPIVDDLPGGLPDRPTARRAADGSTPRRAPSPG